MNRSDASSAEESPARTNLLVWIVTMVLFHAIAMVPLGLYVCYYIQPFVEMHCSFGTELPALTQCLFFLYWKPFFCLCLFILLIAVDSVLLCVLKICAPNRWLATAWANIMWLGIVFAYILVIAGITLPIAGVMWDLA